MHPGDVPSVLAVILNYGTYPLTLQLIPMLKSLHYEALDILVIDNCSPNESAKVLDEQADRLGYYFIANRENGGYAKGNNIGIRYAIEHHYAYTWILNNDVVIREKDVLSHMVFLAELHPAAGCIGPKIFTAQGNVCAPYCNRCSLWAMTFGMRKEKEYRDTQKNVSRTVYRVYGCCMLLKTAFLQAVGGMDERTFLYGEESILAERLLQAGGTAFYDAEVSILHNESSSVCQGGSGKLLRTMQLYTHSRSLYLREYRHFSRTATFFCNLFGNAAFLFRSLR